jgi:hypothetical protein
LFLGMVSPSSVTPSKVIDEVWHAHILFTRAYRQFCQEVFGHPFDHDPELIPADDQTAVFQAQYLATLDLYRREFGAEPPVDIWAVPKFRPKSVEAPAYEPRSKHVDRVSRDHIPESTPLHVMFDSSTHAEHHLTPAEPWFGGGGGFGGGGSGRLWDSIDLGHSHSGGSEAGGDAGGSSCSSSSCTGGGCGGGGGCSS